jgi:hypothetical protein
MQQSPLFAYGFVTRGVAGPPVQLVVKIALAILAVAAVAAQVLPMLLK